jgi:amidohydrolase
MALNPNIHQSIKTIQGQLCELSLKIHANPELGFKEVQACAWQIELLKEWGFEVETPYAGMDTAYCAVYGSGEPAFVVVSEYDALPGMGHACGHNLICACSMGAGKAIADYLERNKLPGTLLVMGAPAEEYHGGKIPLVEQGCFDKIDAAVMAHPSGNTQAWYGNLGVTHYDITYNGLAAHAGGSPEKGKNALDAVMLLFMGINAWRQHTLEDSRVHGIVTEGGDAANIVPEKAACSFYVRANDIDTLAAMKKRFERIAKAAAMMTDTEVEINVVSGYKPGLPNKTMNMAYHELTEELGMNPIIPERGGRGSTDFSDVSQVIPGAHVYFAICDKDTDGHSKAFAVAAASEFGQQQMLKAAEALANIGVRFFSDPEFRAAVIKEKRKV